MDLKTIPFPKPLPPWIVNIPAAYPIAIEAVQAAHQARLPATKTYYKDAWMR